LESLRGSGLKSPWSSPRPPPPAPPLPLPPIIYSVRFWGRITATTGDYFIACGVLTTADFPTRKWFFATGADLSLRQLPEVSAEHAALAAGMAAARFVGNPAARLGADADAPEEEEEAPAPEEGAEEGAEPPPRKILFTEAVRLAATVAAIEDACGVVPVGAFSVNAARHIVPNLSFAGVSASQATALSSWAHFRVPRDPARAATLAKAAAVPGTSDFLDSLASDEPKGVWGPVVDAARGIVRISSLLWPGYFGFASIDGTAKWGSVYVGDGRAAEIQWSL
jgi:hypothetical protein